MSSERRPIPGATKYTVDERGVVMSKHGTVISHIPSSRKYHRVNIWCDDGIRRSPKVHRLVALAFLPNPNNPPIVRHLDDDRHNNHVSNLAWGTQMDNRRDAALNGRAPYSPHALCMTPKCGMLFPV